MRRARSNGSVEKPDLFQRPDCAPDARLREPKGGVVRQLAPINRKRAQEPRGRGPEPAQKDGQGKGRIPVPIRPQSRRQPVAYVMRQAVGSSVL